MLCVPTGATAANVLFSDRYLMLCQQVPRADNVLYVCRCIQLLELILFVSAGDTAVNVM
jgi:hypothetical protein